MMFPDFLPIENRGMSVLTAFTFFFISVGGGFVYSLFKREFKRIGDELKRHEGRLEEGRNDIAGMKTNIALTLQSVTRMERILERRKED